MCAIRGKCACRFGLPALYAHFAAFVLDELKTDPEWERLVAQLNILFPVK